MRTYTIILLNLKDREEVTLIGIIVSATMTWMSSMVGKRDLNFHLSYYEHKKVVYLGLISHNILFEKLIWRGRFVRRVLSTFLLALKCEQIIFTINHFAT